jgi:creatinine amidohydrolase
VTQPLLLQELSREDARARAPRSLLVLPVGALEQHGPHLPVGTDDFAVEHIARRAAALAGERIPVLVAPTLPFGSSHHHLPFGGTMSLGTETYYRVIHDLAESLIVSGFRRIFILNGHGGNHELIQLAARDLALKHPADLAAASYWTIAWEALVALGAHEAGRLPGHAGVFETSVVLALRRELVREPRPQRDGAFAADPRGFAAPYRAELHGSWQQIEGFTDSPARASAEFGRRCLEVIATAVAGAFVEFYEASQANEGTR